jgi:glutathione peroxidase
LLHAKFLFLPIGFMLAASRERKTRIEADATAPVASALWGRPAPADSAKALAYDFSFEAIEGGRMPLEQWRGKVLLVVNTASFCGFTPQYEGLQALWQRYLARGLVVIGVPSNDFGGQEPKAEAEILGFCKGAYNVSFPLTSNQVVSGGEAQSLGADAIPKWNFHKDLVGRDGRLLGAFPTRVSPQAPELIQAIEAALAKG